MPETIVLRKKEDDCQSVAIPPAASDTQRGRPELLAALRGETGQHI